MSCVHTVAAVSLLLHRGLPQLLLYLRLDLDVSISRSFFTRREARGTGWLDTSGKGGGVGRWCAVRWCASLVENAPSLYAGGRACAAAGHRISVTAALREQLDAKVVRPYDTKHVIPIQVQRHQDICETLTTSSVVVYQGIYEFRCQESRYEGLFVSPSSGRSILEKQNTKRWRQ